MPPVNKLTSQLFQAVFWLLLLGLLSQPLAARELAVDSDQLLEVEIASLLLTQAGQPVVLLRQPGHQEMIPIFIGPQEARSLSDALQDNLAHRPQSHDLVNQVFLDLGVQLKRLLIDDLQDGAYLGFLELQLPNAAQPQLIDTRPSDGLALALRAGASIYVGPRVLESAALLESSQIDPPQIQALGISVSTATDELRQALELPDKPGVLVTETQGQAQEAGLQPGSLITAINGQAPRRSLEFLQFIRQIAPGEAIAISYWQGDQLEEITLESGFTRRQPTPKPQPSPDL